MSENKASVRQQLFTGGIIISLVLGSFIPITRLFAAISSCTAVVSPHTVTPGSTTNLQIQLTNTDSSSTTVRWISISRPSGYMRVTNASAAGWQADTTEDEATLTGGTVLGNGSLTISVTTVANNSEYSAQNWVVRVSDDSSGLSPTQCTGDTSVAVSGLLADDQLPNIDNIKLSKLTSSSVTISWTTNESTTPRIDYGTTEDYGSTKSSTTFATSHSLILTGLTADTGYHYQIIATDASGNAGYSGDNTFLTPEAPPPGSTTPETGSSPSTGTSPGSGTTPSTGSGLAPTTTPKEKIPPTIKLTSTIEGPQKEPPKISGEAADNDAISKIEYSTDDGQNWQKVDETKVLKNKKVEFSFTPVNLEDDNYNVRARATDASGNIAITDVLVLIIDRLPPRMGSSVISVGPESLLPESDGILTTIAGVDQKITLSGTGGPISVTVEARSITNKGKVIKISLTRSPLTGLWNGVLGLKEPGYYSLHIDALDGANNTYARTLGLIYAYGRGTVFDTSTDALIKEATVTLYYHEPLTRTWAVWDGAPYGQANPQKITAGTYSFFVPPGKYYLKATSPGKRTTISRIITTDKHGPLAAKVTLPPALRLGEFTVQIPWPKVQELVVEQRPQPPKDIIKNIVDSALPNFALTKASGQPIQTLDLRGKPTVITAVTTWSPLALEQLEELSNLSSNTDVNVVPLSTLETATKLRAVMQVGEYTLDPIIDKDGTLIEPLVMQATPTHYLIDRRGIVKGVRVGILSKEELLDQLSSL